MKKALVALLVSGMITSAYAKVVVEEGFNDVGSLQGKGWVLENNSTPGGLAEGWFRGDQDKFDAQGGAPETFLASNFNTSAAGGELNNWLYTPEFTTLLGVTVSFWLRAVDEAGFSDQISYGFTDASGVPIRPMPSLTVAKDGWTQYSAWIGPREGSARFAFQYSGLADLSNYVGIDSVMVDVPEPASILILAAGAMGLFATRRRKRV